MKYQQIADKLNARAARRAFFIGHAPLFAGVFLAAAYAVINRLEAIFA